MTARGRLTHKIGVVATGCAANTASILAVYALVARAWTPAECGLFGAGCFAVVTAGRAEAALGGDFLQVVVGGVW